MDRKRKLSERNLDIRTDMQFVKNLVRDLQVEAEPEVRGVILDLAYTLARDKLVEAKRFATLANHSNVSVEDLKMTQLDRTDELKGKCSQEPPPMPSTSRGLMLPSLRHCQPGMMADLEGKESKQAPAPPDAAAGGFSNSSSSSVSPMIASGLQRLYHPNGQPSTPRVPK
ncbi:uncharacterized protein LOC108033587 [Drosophila biarmipes]|uniref:uncharacterized protein LOC108033587 n=1 Tax=Drosophila biarmipes TaxID=125945 RepID=UPI0007E73714|nr:uncharacterized protein LOC108033587 [Drosophila biarmipes]